MRWASVTLINFAYVDEVVMHVHDEFKNLSNGQSLRPPVRNSLFEQPRLIGAERKRRGEEGRGLRAWTSATLIHLAYDLLGMGSRIV